MIYFNEIVEHKEYRERIIKHFRLPIRLSANKTQFLNYLNFMREIDKDKYNNMIKMIENDFNIEAEKQLTNEPDFTMENILKPIIEEFEKTTEWQNFIKKDYSDVLIDFEGVTSTHGFYVKENDGKCFLSIDLQTANWQSLQSIIGFQTSYEELITKYTDNLIPPTSKTMRTKITGLLNAKKIMNYNQKILLDNKDSILEVIKLESKVNLNVHDIIAFYADEFIIEVTEEEMKSLMAVNYDEIENDIFESTGVKVHFRPFKLKWLNINKGCVKLYKNTFDIINISKDILLIINKIDNDIEVNTIDLENIKSSKLNEKELCDTIIKVLQEIKAYYEYTL